jgi:hypothetical protein
MMSLPPLTVIAAGDGWVQLVVVLIAGAIGLINWIIQQANKNGAGGSAGSDDSEETPADRYARRRQAQHEADTAAAQYAPAEQAGYGYYQVPPAAARATEARAVEAAAPPPRPAPPRPPAAAVLLGGMNRTTLARLFVVSEILGPPRSLRDEPPAPAPADSEAAPAAPRDEPAR